MPSLESLDPESAAVIHRLKELANLESTAEGLQTEYANLMDSHYAALKKLENQQMRLKGATKSVELDEANDNLDLIQGRMKSNRMELQILCSNFLGKGIDRATDFLKDRLVHLSQELELVAEQRFKAEIESFVLQMAINTLQDQNQELEARAKHYEEQHARIRAKVSEILQNHQIVSLNLDSLQEILN